MVALLGALGDLHGDFEAARRAMRRHPDVEAWLSVGDVGGDEGVYEPVPAPLYWIKGNNENFDLIERMAAGELRIENLHYLPNGRPLALAGLTIVGLGGTFAPTWYDTDPARLPHPRRSTMKATVLADKRRHFVRAEVEACRRLGRADVLLTHEAPRPFRIGRVDAGKTPINELLAALRPRLHLFGHHHRFVEAVVQGVRTVCLDLASRSYLLVDARTLAYEKRDA